MKKQKRGMSGWGWVLVILILIAVGFGIWYLLGSDGGVGGGIPQPPALPD